VAPVPQPDVRRIGIHRGGRLAVREKFLVEGGEGRVAGVLGTRAGPTGSLEAMTSTSSDRAAKNREIVLRGFQEFAEGNIDVLRRLLREDFVEHSPDNPSGRDAFIEFIRGGSLPSSRLDLKRVIADDTYVVLHYHLTRPDEEGAGEAVVDIWRLEDGLIVEHWDTVQSVPSADRIPQGMF